MFLFFTTFLFIFQSVSATVRYTPKQNTTTKDIYFIRKSCNMTEYPDVCFTSLASYASAVHKSPGKLAKVSIAVSITKAKSTAAYLSTLSRSANNNIISECVSFVEDAKDDMKLSLRQLRSMLVEDAAGRRSGKTFRGLVDDVRTYLSSSLASEDTCIDGLEETGQEGVIKNKVSDSVNELIRITSDALTLVTLYANNGAPPPPFSM
ncbi:Pectinesterase inhibitor 7 [Cardamine amara subsp. amara]|uniref:Pectinesterase inhibitor 7 n=1 Tax=Cardamine amara subsp. amara TaxID=228776 RepID=A0ABD1BQM5_CARAN